MGSLQLLSIEEQKGRGGLCARSQLPSLPHTQGLTLAPQSPGQPSGGKELLSSQWAL